MVPLKCQLLNTEKLKLANVDNEFTFSLNKAKRSAAAYYQRVLFASRKIFAVLLGTTQHAKVHRRHLLPARC